MPKAVRLFFHDSIKLTMGSNVPGLEFEKRVIRVQGANINVIDLSKRLDIDAVEISIRVKTGVKYDPPPLALPTEEKEFIKIETSQAKSLSGVSKFISRHFKRNK